MEENTGATEKGKRVRIAAAGKKRQKKVHKYLNLCIISQLYLRIHLEP